MRNVALISLPRGMQPAPLEGIAWQSGWHSSPHPIIRQIYAHCGHPVTPQPVVIRATYIITSVTYKRWAHDIRKGAEHMSISTTSVPSFHSTLSGACGTPTASILKSILLKKYDNIIFDIVQCLVYIRQTWRVGRWLHSRLQVIDCHHSDRYYYYHHHH